MTCEEWLSEECFECLGGGGVSNIMLVRRSTESDAPCRNNAGIIDGHLIKDRFLADPAREEMFVGYQISICSGEVGKRDTFIAGRRFSASNKCPVTSIIL